MKFEKKMEKSKFCEKKHTEAAVMVFCHRPEARGPAVHLVGLAVVGESHEQTFWILTIDS